MVRIGWALQKLFVIPILIAKNGGTILNHPMKVWRSQDLIRLIGCLYIMRLRCRSDLPFICMIYITEFRGYRLAGSTYVSDPLCEHIILESNRRHHILVAEQWRQSYDKIEQISANNHLEVYSLIRGESRRTRRHECTDHRTSAICLLHNRNTDIHTSSCPK
jgi:hypothetical protein